MRKYNLRSKINSLTPNTAAEVFEVDEKPQPVKHNEVRTLNKENAVKDSNVDEINILPTENVGVNIVNSKKSVKVAKFKGTNTVTTENIYVGEGNSETMVENSKI